MTEEANLGVEICEKQKKQYYWLFGGYGHSLKENFEFQKL